MGRPRKTPQEDKSDAALEFEAIVSEQEHVIEGDVITPSKTLKKTKPTGEKKTLSRYSALKASTQVLATSHSVAARALDLPELVLSETEAKALATAGLDLLEVYGISLSSHPKVSAWVTFLCALGEIEVPRVVILLSKPPKRRDVRVQQQEIPPIILPDFTSEEVVA